MKFLIQIRTIIEENVLKQEDFVNKVVKLVKDKKILKESSGESLSLSIRGNGWYLKYNIGAKALIIGPGTAENYMVKNLECEQAMKILASFQKDPSFITAQHRHELEREEMLADFFVGMGGEFYSNRDGGWTEIL